VAFGAVLEQDGAKNEWRQLMDVITQIFILAVFGAVISIFVLIFSSAVRNRGKTSRNSSDGGFWSGMFGDAGNPDSDHHHHTHHGHHHHHDAGGSHHHGGFDGGGHHGGFDGGGGGHH